jgi:GTPase
VPDKPSATEPFGLGQGACAVIAGAIPIVSRARARGQRRPPSAARGAAGGGGRARRAIDLDVVESGIVPLGDIRPATYIGSGKVEEIAGLVKSLDIGS